MSVGPICTGVDLTRRYGGVTALDRTSFTVTPGVTGLVGANGAGKSTLMRLILGLEHPDDGTLDVLGLDPTAAGPAVRAKLGFSPEHHRLPTDVRAQDWVRHLGEVHGLPPDVARSRASDVLWLVGLGEERVRPLGTMSTGQRQRVKLAQALVHDPDLVLLDEPTEGLDPTQRDAMLELIRLIGSQFGIHVILSSHVLDEVERICDGVILLASGKVVAAGRLDELQAGDGALLIDVESGAAELATALRDRGHDASDERSRVIVTIDGGSGSGGAPKVDEEHGRNTGLDQALDDTRDLVVDLGLGLRRLERRRASLEDLLLTADAPPVPTGSPT